MPISEISPISNKGVPNSTSIHDNYIVDLSHRAVDRVAVLASKMHKEYTTAKKAEGYLSLAKLGGKVLILPVTAAYSGSFKGLATQALMLDGTSRLNTVLDSLKKTNSTEITSIQNEAMRGMIRTGTVFAKEFRKAGMEAVEESLDELLFSDELTTREKIANNAVVIGGTGIITYIAYNTAKSALYGLEFAALGYEAYKHKDTILDHPIVQSLSAASLENTGKFLSSTASKSMSLIDKGVVQWNGLSTEDKITSGIALTAALGTAGYSVTLIPAAISAVNAVSSPILTVGKNVARGYILLNTAEYLFNSNG
jgi:hypothetical protein